MEQNFPVEIRTPIKGTKNLCPTIERPEITKSLYHRIACRGIEPLVSSVKGRHLNHSTNRPRNLLNLEILKLLGQDSNLGHTS